MAVDVRGFRTSLVRPGELMALAGRDALHRMLQADFSGVLYQWQRQLRLHQIDARHPGQCGHCDVMLAAMGM